jgi:hypothetical protein
MNEQLTDIFEGLLQKSNGIIKGHVFYCSASFDQSLKEYKGIKIYYSDLIKKDIVYYSNRIIF